MAEEKTYVFGEGAGNNGILSLLGPMLSQRGVDPNVLLAMQGRNNDGFGEGGWFTRYAAEMRHFLFIYNKLDKNLFIY